MAAPQNPSSKTVDASLDAIPMKKSNPMVILGIIGGVLLVGGAIAFKSMSDKPKKAAAVAASGEVDPLAGMSAEDRKRHIEITRKSLATVAAQQAEDDAKKKAAEDAKKAEEAAKPTAGGGPAPAAGGGDPVPVAAKAPEEAPKKKAPTTVEKKKMDDLDKLGSDISGKLGK